VFRHPSPQTKRDSFTTWRVIAYEEERGIEEKQLAYAECRSLRPVQRALALASCAGLQKKRSRPPGNHAAMRLEPRLDLELGARAVHRRHQGERETPVNDGGGRPLRAPGLFRWWLVGLGLRSTPRLGLPGVSRSCRQRRCLQARWSAIARAMLRPRHVSVVEQPSAPLSAASGGGGHVRGSPHDGAAQRRASKARPRAAQEAPPRDRRQPWGRWWGGPRRAAGGWLPRVRGVAVRRAWSLCVGMGQA
jgi:hypothetical protein